MFVLWVVRRFQGYLLVFLRVIGALEYDKFHVKLFQSCLIVLCRSTYMFGLYLYGKLKKQPYNTILQIG